jgi:hypothetical protein
MSQHGATPDRAVDPDRPSTEQDPPGGARPSRAAAAGAEGAAGRPTWWLPALAFVVGVVLGAVVVGAITSGSRTGTAAPSTAAAALGGTATPSPRPSGDMSATVSVPAQCSALAADAQQAAALLEQAATAARDLDAKTLADVARRMQDVRDRLVAQADACAVAGPSVSATST